MTFIYSGLKLMYSDKKLVSRLLLVFLLCTVSVVNANPDIDKSLVNNKRIIEDEKTGKQWLLHGRTHSEQRFSPLSQINDSNAYKLGLAWYTDLPTLEGPVSTPVVAGGVIYLSISFSRVLAIDAATGEQLWEFDPKVQLDLSISTSWTARVNRGAALWNDKLFIGTGDCRLVAADAHTGEKVWDVLTCDPNLNYGITGAPRVANGLVYIGNGVGDAGVPRGYVTAYEAETGKQVWRFYTVPGDPAKGFENAAMEMAAKTWTGEGWWNSAGGNAWDSMVYDAELQQLYIGTDTGAPWHAEARSPGGGDNLFLNSIVAVDANTGEYKWHYQVTPADAWDFNATNPMVLAELPVRGKARKVLMQAPKNGFFYVLDRVTGELLSAEKYAPVNWATHIDMKTGRPVEAPGVRYYKTPGKPVPVMPGPFGAHNWHPMAYHPELKLMYIPTHLLPTTYSTGGGQIGGVEAPIYGIHPDDHRSLHAAGRLVAWDPVSQSARWTVPQVLPFNGGTLATAGNLVFQGAANGEFSAYAADSGARLWSIRTGSAIHASPVTYESKGEQIVLIPVGHGAGDSRFVIPAYSVTEDARAASGLWAFKLNSTKAIPVIKQPEWVVPKPPEHNTTQANIEIGKRLFNDVGCAFCHGAMARLGPGSSVPDLRYMSEETHKQFYAIVLEGSRRELGMLGYGDFLSAEDARAIYDYLFDLQKQLYDAANDD